MATLSTTVALDMDDWNLGNPLDGALKTHNSHHFIYKDGARAFNFGGHDLTYLNLLLVVPLGGTVRSLDISDSGSNIFSLTGISIAVPALMTFLTTNQFDALEATLFAGRDSITGSTHADILDGFSGNDTINGGDGTDTIKGGLGIDVLTGGTGGDIFAYDSALDSTSTNHDTIADFDAAQDRLQMDHAVTDVDAAITQGRLGNNFDSDIARAANDAHLAAHHAVLFTASTGKHAGETYLVIDQNGAAGYQALGDVVIRLTDTTHLAGLAPADFLT